MSPLINAIKPQSFKAIFPHIIMGLFSSFIMLIPLSAYGQTPDSFELSNELSKFIQKKAYADSIAQKMFLANAVKCPITLPEFTAKTHRLSDYPLHLQDEAARALKAEKYHTIYQTEQIGPNDLHVGDTLLDNNNAQVSATSKDVLNYRQAGFVRVRRNETELIIAQNGKEVCPYSLEIGHSSGVKGKSEGLKITFSHGLINFTENEHELALIIGHEMAHLIEGHSNAGPLGLTRNKSLEFRADRLGVDYLTRAGFDPLISVEFWRRLSDKKSVFPPKYIKHRHLKRYEMLKEHVAKLTQL